MANNHRRLIEESDMLEVLRARGYKTTPKGIYTFLYCPRHENGYEGTNHPQSNCYTKEGQNFCYCSVCAKKFNTKDYLIEKEQISFGKAYDMLYDIMGQPSYYKDGNRRKKTKSEKEKEEKEVFLNEFLGLRFGSISEKFLFPKEKEMIISVKKKFVKTRIKEIEEKLNREVFKEEKRKGI